MGAPKGVSMNKYTLGDSGLYERVTMPVPGCCSGRANGTGCLCFRTTQEKVDAMNMKLHADTVARLQQIIAARDAEITALRAELQAARMPDFWEPRDLDMARKIAADPTLVNGPHGAVARVVGAEAEYAERKHRSLTADSAPFLLKRVLAWLDAQRKGGE